MEMMPSWSGNKVGLDINEIEEFKGIHLPFDWFLNVSLAVSNEDLDMRGPNVWGLELDGETIKCPRQRRRSRNRSELLILYK